VTPSVGAAGTPGGSPPAAAALLAATLAGCTYRTNRPSGSALSRAPNLRCMLLRKRGDPNALRVGDIVVAVEPVGAIPEGTRGRIKVVDGFEWIRYWVAWDTGEWTGSVDSSSVVAESRLEQYKADQAAAAERAAVKAAAPVPAEADATAGNGGGTSGVPEHLLERSRQARARKAAQAAG